MVGRYELITKLAVGGMAEVFLARERGLAGLERLVVIKRILPHLADDPSFIEMFQREARIIARVSHPNVVRLQELERSEDGRYYIALEYIHGTTVRELQILATKAGEELPIGVSLGIAIQACRGLHAAHELEGLDGKPLGLVHRDVTPHNLMCTKNGDVKLLDFGVAKATQAGSEETFSGDLKGKFSYMSPEQTHQEKLDRRSDVFAMGIITWEMLTGRRLFKRKSNLEIMKAITSGDVPPPSRYAGGIDGELDAIIARALAVDRDARFETSHDLFEALRSYSASRDLRVDATAVSRFVSRIAGDTLDARYSNLQEAIERANQGRRGGETTGSGLTHLSDDEEMPTVIDRPGTQSTSTAGTNTSTNMTGLTGLSVSQQTVSGAPSLASGGEARGWIAAIVGLVAVLIAGAWGVGAIGGPSGPPMSMGWAPTVSPEVLRAEVTPLHDYLGGEIDRPVNVVLATSYGDLADKLVRKEIDFAVLPPLLYVRTKERLPDLVPIALKAFDGATMSDGLLLVRRDLDVRELEELEGKRFCLTDKNSTTGNFLPRAYLRSRKHDPSKFMGEVHWSGDHIQAIRDLVDGKCDAAATYSGAVLSADRLGVPVSQIRQLTVTGSIPQDVVCASGETTEEERAKMRAALLAFDPVEVGGDRMFGTTQRISGFSEVEDALYDELREALAAE